MEKWTIIKILNWSQDFFKKYNIENPRLDAEILLSHVMNMQRFYLYVSHEQELNEKQLAAYKALIKQRVNNVPVAYLVGYKEFMATKFDVSSDVLIPRPETETLVDEVLTRLKKISGELKVADIGTGSGAIAVSIAKRIDNVIVDAVDISEKALKIAEQNANKNEVADKIKFYIGDLLEPLNEMKFNAIISNPPYIPTKVIDTLQPEVSKYEPRIALDGGADGLIFYRRLIEDSPKLLVDGGFLAAEIGYDQAEAVTELLEMSKQFKDIKVIKDLSENDRVIIANV